MSSAIGITITSCIDPYIHTMGLRHIQCVYQSQDYLLMFSSVCSRINVWVNICDAGDLRRRPAYYDVTVMYIVSNSSTATFTGQLSLKCFSPAYGQILTSWRKFVLIKTARSRLPQLSLKMPDYEQRFAGGVPGLRSLPRGEHSTACSRCHHCMEKAHLLLKGKITTLVQLFYKS